jgi:Legionella pneumophila major outer membrane protein precursor
VAWLRPSWKGFPAAELTVNPPGVLPPVATVFDTKYDYDPTARVFAGYTGCNGLGVRASYWWFDHNSDFLSLTAPTGVTLLQGQLNSVPGVLAGDRLTSEQSLELQVADAEFTNCFEACGGNMVVSYGVRYAKMRLSLQERIIFVGNTSGVPNLSADYTDEFDGFGPTVGLEFMRPLCCAGLSFYSSLRGSVVVGDSNYRETFRNAAGVVTLGRVEDAHESVAIGDLRIALQYCKCGCFARGGWQSQYWNQVAQLPNFGNALISKGQSSLSLDGFFFEVGMQR